MSLLPNKTVLISGATSGIGRAASIALASQGTRMIILASNSKKAEKLISRTSWWWMGVQQVPRRVPTGIPENGYVMIMLKNFYTLYEVSLQKTA